MASTERAQPQLALLTEDQIQRIHEQSLQILAITGVRVDAPWAREALIRAGAPSPAQDNIVRLPGDLVGAVAFRVIVTDKGGHRVVSEQQVIEITRTLPGETPRTGIEVGVPAVASRDAVTWTSSRAAEAARVRASRLYAEAMSYRQRGDYREGISRLREAVRLDPQLTDAFAEMGGMLYLLGDLDRAQNAYEIALDQQPTMRAALNGAAMIHRQRNEYTKAAERLRTILRYNPNDAETWMHLGDIGIFQGDELLARECYLRATRIDPEATRVIEDSRRRLDLMAEVSRAFRDSEQ